MRSNYIGIYAQDNWQVGSKVSMNFGLRWDPYFPAYSGPGQVTRFDRARFDQIIRGAGFTDFRSCQFRSAPA